MKQLKCYTLIGIIFVLILGTLSHFIFGWTGNHVLAGLFTPVNESVWEHMKLVFFPMLLFSVIMNHKLKKTYPRVTASLCFGILLGTSLIPLFFYVYTFILGGDVFILDIATFVLSVIIAFFTAYKLTVSCKLQHCSLLLYVLTGAFFVCFIIFTFQPPNVGLFADPTTGQ